MAGFSRRAGLIGGLMLLAGCSTAQSGQGPLVASQPGYSRAGLESVLGEDAGTIIRHFGAADLDIREGDARKLQFLSPVCVLDVYLYPGRGGEAVATHIDARLPDGRDMDRASCVAAMGQRRQAR